jgi:hypothetical protein
MRETHLINLGFDEGDQAVNLPFLHIHFTHLVLRPGGLQLYISSALRVQTSL